MTNSDAGAIVLVRFPFTDLTTTKKRPALVVSPAAYTGRYGDVVVLALTSQDQNNASLALAEWQAVGLLKPTWIKPVVGTLSAGLIERQIGTISAQDHKCVRAALDILIKRDWA